MCMVSTAYHRFGGRCNLVICPFGPYRGAFQNCTSHVDEIISSSLFLDLTYSSKYLPILFKTM